MKKCIYILFLLVSICLLSCSGKEEKEKKGVEDSEEKVSYKSHFITDTNTHYTLEVPALYPPFLSVEEERLSYTFTFTPTSFDDVSFVIHKEYENESKDISLTSGGSVIYSIDSVYGPILLEEGDDILLLYYSCEKYSKDYVVDLNLKEGKGRVIKLNSGHKIEFNDSHTVFLEQCSSNQYTPVYKIIDYDTLQTIKTVILKEGRNTPFDSKITYDKENNGYLITLRTDSTDYIDATVFIDKEKPYVINSMEILSYIWDERLNASSSFITKEDIFLYENESIYSGVIGTVLKGKEVTVRQRGNWDIVDNKRGNWVKIEGGWCFSPYLEMLN